MVLMLRLLVASLAALLTGAPLYSQAARGSVSGTVSDSTGAVVPSARVTVLNTERNTRDTRVSNEVGRYFFSDLVPGHYELEATAQGFKVSHLTGLTIEVGQQLEINPSLELGQTAESITIAAA